MGQGRQERLTFGIAGGDGVGLIFKKGEVIKKVPQAELVNALMDEINKFKE